MAASDNERLLVSASKDATAKVWNVERGTCMVCDNDDTTRYLRPEHPSRLLCF